MTIWIDQPMWPAHGRLWSHLVSDISLDELHEFAARAGIPERGFEGDHYDVPQDAYAALVAAGARATDGKDLLRRLRASGLRVQKRRSERVLVSVADAPWLPPGGRADVIASRQDEAPANTVVVRIALLRGDRVWVVARPGHGGDPAGDGDRAGGGEGAGLDLPTRVVRDRSAPDAIAALVAGLVEGMVPDAAAVPTLRGYVRNVVPASAAGTGYPWPVPRACFAVWSLPLAPGQVPRGEGSWVAHDEASRTLGERHWWPLFAGGFA